MSESSDPATTTAATQAIAAGVAQALAAPAARGQIPYLFRVTAPLPDMVPLDWLAKQQHCTQYFWSGRDAHFEMAGVGEADVLAPAGKGKADYPELFRLMRHRLALRHPSQRYYGGFRFHDSNWKGERWRNFLAYRFIVPRFEVYRQKSRTQLACNVLVATREQNEQTLARVLKGLTTLRFDACTARAELPAMISRTDTPDRLGWYRAINEALDACSAHDIEKVVLARETTFTAGASIDSVALLRVLQQYTERSFDFCFHPAPDRAFIGASPERLYWRVNCYLETEAVAGTRPRGDTDARDNALAEELLNSEKDVREHAFVVDALREHLSRFCRSVQEDRAISLLRLCNCQHLYRKLSGLLRHSGPEIDGTLVQALHPTPAVGGQPRDKALAWLEAHEPFDRGIYASPVGWVGHDSAEFAVAIRSALVERNTVTVYSGAGIVPGSDPASEWDEIENKIANYFRAFHWDG